MKPERPKKTARIIQDQAGRRENREQLRRLPTFKLPDDTDEVFGSLLKKLDQPDDDPEE